MRCLTNIECAVPVLCAHDRKTRPLFGVNEYCWDRVWIQNFVSLIFRKIVRFKFYVNIYWAISVLHPHSRGTNPRVRVSEFCWDQLRIKISPRPWLEKWYDFRTPRIAQLRCSIPTVENSPWSKWSFPRWSSSKIFLSYPCSRESYDLGASRISIARFQYSAPTPAKLTLSLE